MSSGLLERGFQTKSLPLRKSALQIKRWLRNRDGPLNLHFLCQCQVVCRHSPAPLGDRKQSWVHSFLQEKWAWSQIVTNSFAPSSQRYILGSFFTRHISSEHSDMKTTFFRHKSGENWLCSRPVSVSATRSREIWAPVFFDKVQGHVQTWQHAATR